MKNTKSIFTGLLLTMFFLPAAWGANIYKCVNNGKVTYTETPARGCSPVNSKSSISVVSPTASASPANRTADDSSSPENSSNNQAQKAYDDAVSALEEGKKERYGNEKNYTRYQERIKALEDNVDRARKNLGPR